MDGVTVQYSNGDTLSVKGLACFKNKTTNKTYLLYTLNEYADGGLIKLYVACLDAQDDVISQEDWKNITGEMVKMTHKSPLPDLIFNSLENKTFLLGQSHPKKIAVKQEQLDLIVEYQKSKTLKTAESVVQSPVVSEQVNPQTYEHKSFFDTSLIENQDKTQVQVDTGFNIFDNPLKPEFQVPVAEEVKEEMKKDTSEEQQADSLVVSEISTPEPEVNFVETPIGELSNEVEDAVKEKESKIDSVYFEIKDIVDQAKEGNIVMNANEKEEIMLALDKASAALTEASEAVASAKNLIDRINTNSVEAQPIPVVEAQPMPVVEAQPMPVTEVQPMPVTEVQPMPVVEAQPMPVVEAQPVPVVEAQPMPVAEVQPMPVVEVQPMPVVEAQPVPVVEAQPMPVVEAQPIPVVEAQPIPVANVQPMPVSEPQVVQAQPAFAEPVVNDAVASPAINVSPISPAQTNEALFGTPDRPYVAPDYNEVPPVTMPVDIAAPVAAPADVYGPGSLDVNAQKTI